MNIRSYEDLLDFLKNWEKQRDGSEYDFVGMAHLLGACLENLEKFSLEAELDRLSECLEEKPAQFLKKLAERISRPGRSESPP